MSPAKPTLLEERLKRHHIACSKPDRRIFRRGTEAELLTRDYLLLNLSVGDAGEYRLLTNCNVIYRNAGGSGNFETDMILITRLGVFLIEVKSYTHVRKITGEEVGDWDRDGTKMNENPLYKVLDHAKTLKSVLFDKYDGYVKGFERVWVAGLVVLANKEAFTAYEHPSGHTPPTVVSLDQRLIRAVSMPGPLIRPSSQQLTPIAINQLATMLSRIDPNQPEMWGHYRILKELPPGDLYDAYVGENITSGERRRLKTYHLTTKNTEKAENDRRLFMRGHLALSRLGGHPNIVQVFDFQEDDERGDTYYEITELIQGKRLDEILAAAREPMPLLQQLDYLEAVAEALKFVHSYESDTISGIVHRNVNPATIYITQRGVIKLGDFDFARLVGGTGKREGTVTAANSALVENFCTAPEVQKNASLATPASDLYSLGAVWFLLASLPDRPENPLSLPSTLPSGSPAANEAPKPPKPLSHEAVDLLNLPEPAKALMKRMLNRPPELRPQKAEEVLTVMRALRSEQTKTADS